MLGNFITIFGRAVGRAVGYEYDIEVRGGIIQRQGIANLIVDELLFVVGGDQQCDVWQMFLSVSLGNRTGGKLG